MDWKQQAQAARIRDNFECQRCGIHQTKLSGGRKRLDVHHVVPYSVSHSNELSNLISLCRRCHIAVEPGPQHIRRRMALVRSGHDERRRESIKAGGKAEADAGPLFGGK
jgi:5-methylcytosine-specific restriction endonuclease McrA